MGTWNHLYLAARFLVLVCLISTSCSKNANRRILRSLVRNVRSTSGSTAASEPAGLSEPDPYLTVGEHMLNQTLTSSDQATFRCKVEGYPTDIQYTWYKDNNLLSVANDHRISIRNKTWGSRLRILDVYTTDAGVYRCEATNKFRRVHTSAHLTVSFNSLPPGQTPTISDKYLKGKCEVYTGFACKEFFEDDYVYVDAFLTQTEMEEHITIALKAIVSMDGISDRCQKYATKAFCYFVFPLCAEKTQSKDATPLHLCQEDCELLQYDVCGAEFFRQKDDPLVAEIRKSADCSTLPPTTSARTTCTKIGLPSVVTSAHKCYNDSGQAYRGTLSVTESGNTCGPWPKSMLSSYPQLSGGHNFCRNPGSERESPWCYVNNGSKPEICQVPQCNFNQNQSPDFITILIPAVSVPLLLGCLVVVFCVACRKRKKAANHTKGLRVETKQLSVKKTKVPELSSNVVHVIGELGDGKYGKVFKAQILSNLHYCPNDPVAVKTLNERAAQAQVQDFQREMETFSELQHPNVACLKAVVVQSSLRCMVFEYTGSYDLHEYLTMHSPQADFAKPPSSSSSHASTIIEQGDFIRMAIQVAAGMEYLSTRNFIHRDLAARNVLVCGNMDLKISNLGVVRDCYLSCYYRSPQGGHMLPIRWMAPESLQNWQFSGKSAVWSFGVLLWEMFSYGLQPHCGYSNHEVLDMITKRQLLSCPDQCPAKVYSLMHECWYAQPPQRPQFKDIHAKLSGWEGTSTTRMTSQLAQGIHRQLTNMRENGAPYPGPHQGTMIDGPPQIQQHVPPSYNTATAPGFHGGSPQAIPSNSLSARYYPSTGAVTSSSGNTHSTNLYPPQYHSPAFPNNLSNPDMRSYAMHRMQSNPHSSAQSRSSGSAASSEYNQHPPIRVSTLAAHAEENYPHGQQGRVSQPLLARDHSVDNEIEESNLDFAGKTQPMLDRARSGSGVRTDPRQPLTVFRGQNGPVADQGMEPPSSPGRPRPAVAPKPNIFNDANQSADNQRQSNPSQPAARRDRSMSPNRLVTGDAAVRRSEVSSAKTTSCDSGLPGDELDSEGADSHRPLIVSSLSNSSPRAGTNGSFYASQS